MKKATWAALVLALLGHNASACDLRAAIRPVTASELVRVFQAVQCYECVAIDAKKKLANDAVRRPPERHQRDLVELLRDQAPRVTLEF
jgi:hypothetical protein